MTIKLCCKPSDAQVKASQRITKEDAKHERETKWRKLRGEGR
jgi:hypothetical protein